MASVPLYSERIPSFIWDALARMPLRTPTHTSTDKFMHISIRMFMHMSMRRRVPLEELVRMQSDSRVEGLGCCVDANGRVIAGGIVLHGVHAPSAAALLPETDMVAADMFASACLTSDGVQVLTCIDMRMIIGMDMGMDMCMDIFVWTCV